MPKSGLTTFRKLGAKFRRIGKKLPEAVSKMTVALAADIHNGLVWVTPVDTTEAISNWQIRVGPGGLHNIPPHFYGRHGETLGRSMAKTLKLAKQALKAKKPNVGIFIVNTADHITDLNEGSSPQAPEGFIEATLDEVLRGHVLKWPTNVFK